MQSYTGTTEANGKATVTLTVSMQPGNNYRGAASLTSEALTQATQTKTDAINVQGGDWSGYSCPLMWSPMLTVWRKLHVEVDSMGAVAGNTIGTAFTDFVGIGTWLTEITGINSINDGSADLDTKPPGNGRFENGAVIVGTAPSTITISPIVANGHTKVVFSTASIAGLPFSAIDNDNSGNATIGGTVIQIIKSGANYVWTLNVTTQSATPIDWPDFVSGTLSVGGGGNVSVIGANGPAAQLTTSALNIPCTLKDDDVNTLLPKAPDTSAMAAAYRAAYVVPVYDVGDNNMNVPFVGNVAENGTAIDAVLDWDSRSANSPDFWVAYVLISFQGALIEDVDPDEPFTTLGQTPSSAGGSLVFIEAIRDGTTNPLNRERDTVVHETGHAVGDSGDHPVTNENSTFEASYLANIRSSTRPRS